MKQSMRERIVEELYNYEIVGAVVESIADKILAIVREGLVARQLIWIDVKPEVFEDWAINAPIEVLKINGEKAYYQVNSVNHEIGAQLWVGNMANGVGDCDFKTVDSAKVACQKHLDRIVLENLALTDVIAKLEE